MMEKSNKICTWRATPRERSPRSANLSIIACTLFSISDLLCARFRIYNSVKENLNNGHINVALVSSIVCISNYVFYPTCSGAPLLTLCILPVASIYVSAVLLSVGLNGRK